MPMFDIIVTRATTESCAMVVEAENLDAAQAHAITRARTDTDLVWAADDTPNANKDLDVTHIEEVEQQ